MQKFSSVETEVVGGYMRSFTGDVGYYFDLYTVTPEILQYFFANRSQPMLSLELDECGNAHVLLDNKWLIKPGDCLAVGQSISFLYNSIEEGIETLDLVKVKSRISTIRNPQLPYSPL